MLCVENFKFNFVGEINKLVEEQCEKNNYKGVISFKSLSDSEKQFFKSFFEKYYIVNWVYFDNTKLYIYTFSPFKIKEKIDLEKLKKDVEKSLNCTFDEFYVYPVKNILLKIEPKYPKDTISKRKEFNIGKLGKKDEMKKMKNFLKKLMRV